MRRWQSLTVAVVLILGVGSPALADEPGEVNVRGEFPTTQKIQNEFGAGAQEIQFRDFTLTNDQLAEVLDPTFLGKIGETIPNDGVERQVKVRAIVEGQRVEARVKRQEDGRLRVRVEGVTFATADEARNLAAGLQDSFDRVRVRGLDAEGNRVRIEVRNGIVRKDEVRPDRRGPKMAEDRRHRGRDGVSRDLNDEHAVDRGRDGVNRHRGREHEVERGRRGDRPDRVERVERREGHERAERPERPERVERVERPERPERVERVEHGGRR
ncbi:MAG: hypothetical protein ACE5IQ_13630 [Candidatus Methylomirabilales bacterium]